MTIVSWLFTESWLSVTKQEIMFKQQRKRMLKPVYPLNHRRRI